MKSEFELNEIGKKLLNTETAKKLYFKLKELSDNEHFLLGTIFLLKEESQKLEMLKLLDKGLKNEKDVIVNKLAIINNTDVETIKKEYGL